MSTSRTFVRSSRLFSAVARTTSRASPRPACLSTRVPTLRRQLATSTRLCQETVDTPSRGQEVPLTHITEAPAGSHARSVAILHFPKRATRSEIESFLQSKGLEITNSQLRLDRFTFFNDKRFFVEFASEEQAQMALETLDGVEFMDKKLSVKPLKKDFVWGRVTHPDSGRSSRFFYEHDAAEGLKPLLEGRRMIFSVQPPGWLEDDSSVRHNKFALEVIEEYLGKYGVEAIGGMSPFFGDMKPHPRMLCLLDFTTTRGAEQAVEAIHETEIHGRKVWLQSSVASSWRAHQIGKVAPALLAELQEKGNASTTPYEDNFVKSDQKKGRENYHTTRTQRVEKKKARKAEEAQKAQ